MRILSATLFCFLLSPFCTTAQEPPVKKLVLIHGIILDAETQDEIINVHVSVNGLTGGVSDVEGKFSLYIYRGDTIIFSYMGYRDVTFLTDTLPGNSYVAGIFLQKDTLQIGEVLVFPRMGDLRSEFMNSKGQESQEILNAQNNIMISTYQGLNNSAELGDPGTNYELLRRRQMINAYEKGGIGSDQMLGLNLFTLIPVSIYLLSNGFPEKPAPPKPHVSVSEIEKMKRSYRESLREKNNE